MGSEAFNRLLSRLDSDGRERIFKRWPWLMG